jgi:AraC-like DNA-binding protein
VVRGSAWVVHPCAEAALLRAGDLAVVTGPDPYVVADHPATPTHVVIEPGQRCTTLRGDDLAPSMALGMRTWGNSAAGETVLLTGTYERQSELSQLLLGALPPIVVMGGDQWECPLLDLLAEEIVREAPGQEAVLDRLLDLLLITCLRTWFDRNGADAPPWYRSYGDPVVGPALRLLQHNPSHPWTVARLASEVGVSRAAFARRFTALVGEPPMTFLTNWRLALAADLLCDTDSTVGAVARQVGYGSAFALSAAFSRVRGLSPSAHREAARLSGGPTAGSA